MKYSVKAASMATGVSESRLRTWERRYGIPHPERSPTGRRLYDEEDLAVIRRMAVLVAAGIPPSEAALAAMTEGAAPEPAAPPEFPSEHPLAEQIRRASSDYDEPATVIATKEAVASLGWPEALDRVLMPALRSIGRSWGENAIVSSNEHFTSEIIRREIAAAFAPLKVDVNGSPTALLACPEDERHEIGLLALSLLIRLRAHRTVYLGADVPTSDLLTAIQETGPAVVCLSATTRSGRASLGRAARALVAARIPVRLFVGGPAFHNDLGDETVAGILLPASIGAAADVVARALAELSTP